MSGIKGVVLFADDYVHNNEKIEYELYQLFRKEYVVMPVDNLDHLRHALVSVSNFDVIILDWEFMSDEPEFQDAPPLNPLSILEDLELFSKIYVYSRATIPASAIDILNARFPGRIEIRAKLSERDAGEDLVAEFEKIKKELEEFTSSNKNLDFSVAWGRAINQSLQSIFAELASVNEHWVKEVYQSSLADNSNAILEVVELLNNLLAERLVQNASLRDMIEAQGVEKPDPNLSGIEAAKLFQRIYYTKILDKDVPYSTGDIFDISNDDYAILITPECEVYDRINGKVCLKSDLEILRFHKSSILTDFDYNKEDSKKFNQNTQTMHFLPSFPYVGEEMLLPASISFLNALKTVSKDDLEKYGRRYKLNSPYIQQLRQRYSSWHGRIGVPAVNESIKAFNLGQLAIRKKEIDDAYAIEHADEIAAELKAKKEQQELQKAKKLAEAAEKKAKSAAYLAEKQKGSSDSIKPQSLSTDSVSAQPIILPEDTVDNPPSKPVAESTEVNPDEKD